MSQSLTNALDAQLSGTPANDSVVLRDADEVQTLLDALDDADCRAILEATGDDPLSASEIADACDLPLSTTYRKVDMLSEAGLVEERTRICASGKHTSEYVRGVENVVFSVDADGGVALEVSRRDDDRRPTAPATVGGR
jgi:DNA-binding transcriptional ArsR family regulator